MKALNLLNGMQRIESKEDMIKWATAINGNPMTIAEKCDYQDIWARSGYNDLQKFFMEVNGERKLILCSVYNTMSYEEVERLLLHYAKTKGNEIVNKAYDEEMVEVNKMRSEIFKREGTFKECLKGYWKRMADLRRENKRLVDRNNHLVKEVDRLREAERASVRYASDQKAKADRYDAIRNALL